MFGTTSFEISRFADQTPRNVKAEWRMSYLCLQPDEQVRCALESVAKVLKFSIMNLGKYPHPGFTIIYKHLASPEIIQLSPFSNAGVGGSKLLSQDWRSPDSLFSVNSPRLQAIVRPASMLLSSIPSSAESHSPTSWIVVDHPTSTKPSHAMTISSSHPTITLSKTFFKDVYIPETSSTQSSPTSSAVPKSHPEFQVPSNLLMSPGHLIGEAQLKAKNLINKTKSKLASVNSYVTSSQSRMIPTDKTWAPSDGTNPQILLHNRPDYDPINSASPSFPAVSSENLMDAASLSPITQNPNSQDARAMCVLKFTPLVFIFLCLAGGIVKHIARNPRRRAEWAAKREECRNRHMYARAARYHKIRNWFQRLRHSRAQCDSQEDFISRHEKHVSTSQPHIYQADIDAELRAMRDAHGFVDNIIKAEEGRSGENIQISHYQEWGGWDRWRTRVSRSDSDVTGPPPYEEEGPLTEWFRYTQAGSDDTPDSSVIDTSSRDSDCEKD